jgi:hypothetical protein
MFYVRWFVSSKLKQERFGYLTRILTHVTLYTLVIAIFGWLSGGLSYWGLGIVYVGHIILDRRTFVDFWVRRIQMAGGPEKVWLGIVADQIFHIILIVVAVYMTSVGIF